MVYSVGFKNKIKHFEFGYIKVKNVFSPSKNI